MNELLVKWKLIVLNYCATEICNRSYVSLENEVEDRKLIFSVLKDHKVPYCDLWWHVMFVQVTALSRWLRCLWCSVTRWRRSRRQNRLLVCWERSMPGKKLKRLVVIDIIKRDYCSFWKGNDESLLVRVYEIMIPIRSLTPYQLAIYVTYVSRVFMFDWNINN